MQAHLKLQSKPKFQSNENNDTFAAGVGGRTSGMC